ncbi:MAG: leucyl aminopeptidase family protein [Xanthomonadales bacterium]|nr:leucyl aminopeptidase family protein [Xanthomonadales bacterium]
MSDPTIRIKTLTRKEFETFEAEQPPETRDWVRANGFDGSAGTWVMLPAANGGQRRILCGVGDKRSLYSIAHLANQTFKGQLELDEDWCDPQVERMALGYRLGAYRFDRYKEAKAAAELLISADSKTRFEATVDACYRVRDLVNTPSEDMGPEQLADAAVELAEAHGGTGQTIVGERLLEENFPAIHAVGRAAERAPRLIELNWGKDSDPRLALVGKGVCFDSGGLNIKGASGMRLMKKDMGGAAHVLGLAGLIMALELPVRLKVLIPAVENAIAGNAYRPGDIIPTRAGKSVEIGNTDAEGRVVLSDALAYGSEWEPDLMIDFATLTGAARIALGPDLPPIYCNDDKVASACLKAADRVEDPLWRMPLFPEYEELINTPIADVSNSGSTPMGGSITAALFLQRFVGQGIPWCHLDVYAWTPNAKPGRPAGGEAQGLRAIYSMLERRYRG